jgi:hypothetical protein
MSRLIKHQLVTAASLPPIAEAHRALGAKAHSAFLEKIAARLAKIDTDLLSLDTESTVQ